MGIGTVTGERSPAAFKVGGLLRDVGSWEGVVVLGGDSAGCAVRGGGCRGVSRRGRAAGFRLPSLARGGAACAAPSHVAGSLPGRGRVRPYRASDDRRVVVLSACEALHGAVGLLGGPHIRFVHELVTTEGTVVRLLGWLARRGCSRGPSAGQGPGWSDRSAACRTASRGNPVTTAYEVTVPPQDRLRRDDQM